MNIAAFKTGQSSAPSHVPALGETVPTQTPPDIAAPPYCFFVWVPVVTPAGQKIPLIITDEGDVLDEAWHFFHSGGVQGFGLSWKEKAARFISRFYSYFRARQNADGAPELPDRWIDDCIIAFQFGTIEENGDDPLKLFWAPMPEEGLQKALGVLRRFCI